MKKIIRIIFIFSITLLFSYSCNFFCETGSGNVTKYEHEIEPFTEIDINGVGTVYLSQKNKNSVEIKTDDNLQELITVKVKKGRLVIENDKCIENFTELEIFITFKDLSYLEMTGLLNVESKGKIKSDDLDIEISDAVKADLKLDLKKLDINLDKTATVKLNGSVKEVEINMDDASLLNAYKFKIQNAEIYTDNSSKCYILVKSDLKARAEGSSVINYKGNPKNIDSKVDDAGTINADNLINIFN